MVRGNHEHSEPISIPRINAVGVAELPPGHGPRTPNLGLRAAALAMLTVFAIVTVITTTISVGQYCLTSDAANNAALPAAFHSEPK